MTKQQSDQQAPDTTITVQKRVNGFKLNMRKSRFYDWVGGFMHRRKGKAGFGGSAGGTKARTVSPKAAVSMYSPNGSRFIGSVQLNGFPSRPRHLSVAT